MYIEDLISKLYHLPSLNAYDRGIVVSFNTLVAGGLPFTQKQSHLAVKILTKYCSDIYYHYGTDIIDYIKQPKFLREPTKFNSAKTIEIDNDRIIVKFPYDETLLAEIRDIKAKHFREKTPVERIDWHPDSKSWQFDLVEDNILFINDHMVSRGFSYDTEFEIFLNQTQEIRNAIEQHVPCVVKTDTYKFINVHPNCPQPQTSNLLDTMFLARKLAINTWDTAIDYEIKTLATNPVTRAVIESGGEKFVQLNHASCAIADLAELFSHNNLTVVIVPGVDELLMMKELYSSSIASGITNKQMSVLFRLDNKSNKEFNEFVADREINNKITPDTKVIFISKKLPKILIQEDVKPDNIVVLGGMPIHYTLTRYIEASHSVIRLPMSGTTGELNFG